MNPMDALVVGSSLEVKHHGNEGIRGGSKKSDKCESSIVSKQSIQLTDKSPTWIVHGYDEPFRLYENHLPMASSFHQQTNKKMISICIRCDMNETSISLERTIKSLKNQVLPYGYMLDVMILFVGSNNNGVDDEMSQSMRRYVTSFVAGFEGVGSRDEEIHDHENFFSTLPSCTMDVMVIEPMSIVPKDEDGNRPDIQDIRISFVVVTQKEKHKLNPLDCHMEWLSRHAQSIHSEYILSLDCGNILYGTHVIYELVSRLQSNTDSVAVTGYYSNNVTSTRSDDGHNLYDDKEHYQPAKYQSFVDPLGYFLLHEIQKVERAMMADYDDGTNNSEGLLQRSITTPILQGPCGLYKTEAFMELWNLS